MGSRGAGSGRNASGNQKATNAKSIENMNEAQLDNEIAKAQRNIDNLDKVMNKNSLDTAENRAMREAFPLGVGNRSEAQEKALSQKIESDVNKAVAYTNASDKKSAEQSRLKALQDAKSKIAGTGKTEKQMQTEAVKKAVSETPKTLKWQTTQKGGWANGGYAPKIIKAGNIEIHSAGSLYTVYQDGKMIGRTDKLNKAKAAAERLSKKK